MLNKEQKDKLKLIVESIDDKLTKEGYIFTARHFDVVMDGMQQLLKQCNVSSSLLSFEQCLREEFLVNTQNYPKEYHQLFKKKYEIAEKRFREQSGNDR